MFIFMPGEVIALFTFPGVILHEMAHKFFCDIGNVPVYVVHFFRPGDKTAGCVIHASANDVKKSYLIAIGPLLINSVVCMLLLFPRSIVGLLETDFIGHSHSTAYSILEWLGFSIGLHAIPSNQDMNEVIELAGKNDNLSKSMAALVNLTVAAVYIFNTNYISFFLKILYVLGISHLIPALLLKFY
ncbi:MAG: metalloprotease family protein [Candidatus Dependentiae bacterium]|nr:metalloprotease family protein [Candidatus Dependentiae bacterium]